MTEGGLKQLEWYRDLKRFEGSRMNERTVMIVDEAGMIGTRQWEALLYHAEKAGAKVIAVGDDHQFKAIEAGDFFREIKAKAGASHQLFTLQTIRRQKHAWMCEASRDLSELNIQKTLSTYEQHGHVHQTDSQYLEKDVAYAYVERILDGQSGVVLAFTNAQTQRLNEAIRSQLQYQGALGREELFTLNGKTFVQGDKIVF